jgi:hypothetical protein
MNPLVLTKISKFSALGSLVAYLSFASKNNVLARQFFLYLIGGTLIIFVIAALWESRDYLLKDDSTEESLSTLVSGLSNQKPKRQYYLSAQTRLEIVIAFVVIAICALIGAI